MKPEAQRRRAASKTMVRSRHSTSLPSRRKRKAQGEAKRSPGNVFSDCPACVLGGVASGANCFCRPFYGL